MTIVDKVYDATDRFYIDGKLHEQDVDGTYLFDLLDKLLSNEKRLGNIYDFIINQDWSGAYDRTSFGYIAVSWMDEYLHQIVFELEEDY